MPIEYTVLQEAPCPLAFCPACGDMPFDPMMRGMVQRSRFKWIIGPTQPYCALICSKCKRLVCWEHPEAAQKIPAHH